MSTRARRRRAPRPRRCPPGLPSSPWCRARGWTGALVAATMLAVMPSALRALEIVSSGRAVADMAAEVRRLTTPETVLVHEGPIENSGALELYASRRPILVDAQRSVLGFGAT